MRGDVDGYTYEYNPANNNYKAWYPAYKNVKMWRLVGNGSITLDQAKRLKMYKDLQRLLLEEQLQCRSSRSRSSRSSASASRTCTSRSATSTPVSKTAWVE